MSQRNEMVELWKKFHVPIIFTLTHKCTLFEIAILRLALNVRKLYDLRKIKYEEGTLKANKAWNDINWDQIIMLLLIYAPHAGECMSAMLKT